MIIQAQRRAIEALKPLVGQPWPQEAFANKCSFYIGQGPTVRPLPSLVLLGFSRGIGTCSDIKGIDVAVFGYRSFNLWSNYNRDTSFKRRYYSDRTW